jgi:hypothetical protein
LSVAPRAAAQGDELGADPHDRIRLEYQAPPECPDAETFKILVGSRVPPGWEAAPEERARRIDVVVSGAHGSYQAAIQLVDERGERVTRAVRGRACSDVVDGIALVTVLAIQARVGELEERTAPAPVARRSAQAPAPAPPARSGPEAPRSEQAVGGSAAFAALRVSARAAVAAGIGPSAAWGGGLGIVLEWPKSRLGAALQALTTGRVEANGVPVRFELFAARLEGCPYVLALADWVSLEPCPFGELGTVTGRAYEDPPAVVQGSRDGALWASLGGTGRAVGRFGAVAVEVEALLGVPLRREEFYIDGGEVPYRVPTLYGAAAAGVGVRF